MFQKNFDSQFLVDVDKDIEEQNPTVKNEEKEPNENNNETVILHNATADEVLAYFSQ